MESSAPYRTLEQGEMLNWYRIERILGRGGFGVIYLARDTNLEHDVAIKEYVPGDIARRETDSRVLPLTEEHGDAYHRGLERFITEARNLVRFRHPNIVRVMSVFQENNTAYMVMEFEEGENLREHFANAPRARGEPSLKGLVVPIAEGLAEVHRAGFIHRDIKPSNILVRADGSPVLLDFGSARNAGGLATRQNLTALVSAGYAPLEQYDDEGSGGVENQQGPWTDIYALGGVLYHAVSGSDPVDSTRRASAVFNGGRDPLLPATLVGKGSYDDAFLRAIDWALSFRVADRPQTLADWLPALLSGTRPPSAAPPPTFGGGRHRRVGADSPTARPEGAPPASDDDLAATRISTRGAARAVPTAAPPEPSGTPAANAPTRAETFAVAERSPAAAAAGRRVALWGGALAVLLGAGWFLSGDARLIALFGGADTAPPLADSGPIEASPTGAGLREEAARLAEETAAIAEAQAAAEARAEAARLAEAAEAREAEATRVAEAREAAEAREVEEARVAEEARLAEVRAREAEEAKAAEEARLAEVRAREAEEAKAAEEARLAEVRAREAEEARAAEEARLVEVRAREAEEARAAEEARLAEVRAREAEEAKAAEEARLAEIEAREAEEARLAEEVRLAKAADAAVAEAREAERARVAEETRLAEAAKAREAEEAKAAERARLAEARRAREAEARRPVSDTEISEAMERFEALRRAIVGQDAAAMDALTEASGQNRLFRQLMDGFDELDVSLGDIRVRNADKAIAATLSIRSMIRSNGDRAEPSDAYRDRDIVSTRQGDGWSTIVW